ncbi:P-loop containing nucleoside triphosphate hydrolase protein [Chytriomyces sp. MP71]|nr:P-loop containing nucleoside triphosphate hydrolase protein [Chytriomyces sp. MP71]
MLSTGPNGAGKSTTMKIISGLEACTWGQVRFSSSSKGVETLTASHQPTEFLAKSIGYCPQHDALWPQVTAREHLTLYATLRGVLNVHAAVEESLTESAVEHPDLPVKGLSGGNKRRLMLAVATIGNPALLLLDEPTTGVDVSIRRSIWSHITRLKRTCAVLLTSHSMEEVDALSDRVGILVNGGLRCLGTGSRLKSAYGSGYTLTVKVRAAETAASVAAWFPSGHVVLRSSNGCTVVLDVVGGREGLKEVGNSLGVLKRIFDVLREHAGEVEDYGVSQPTLQQVFVDFAKKQREMRE